MYVYKHGVKKSLRGRGGVCRSRRMAEDVKARIVDAAVRLLESKGAKGFGQVRVAREAGLQQGHLTYYFPKKSDLVAAVLARLSERARGEFERALAHRGPLDAAASEEVFFDMVRALLRDRKRSRILAALLAEAVDDAEVGAALGAPVRLRIEIGGEGTGSMAAQDRRARLIRPKLTPRTPKM